MGIKNLFPEIEEIQDIELRMKVEKSFEKAIELGRWKEEELKSIPFTLLIPELIQENSSPSINIIDHIRAVTQLSISIYEIYEKIGLAEKLNRDALIAGALLHDIGKFVEYEKDSTGKIIQTTEGKRIRHPALGLELVYEFNLPLIVRQAIVFHSKEGDKIDRLPEVEIIHRCDFLCFEPVRKIYGY